MARNPSKAIPTIQGPKSRGSSPQEVETDPLPGVVVQFEVMWGMLSTFSVKSRRIQADSLPASTDSSVGSFNHRGCKCLSLVSLGDWNGTFRALSSFQWPKENIS